MNEATNNTQASPVPQWYVIHTYSGYENKVTDDLRKTVENNGLGNLIFDVKIPIEVVAEIKNGRRRMVQHKIYPGYVLVNMIMTDEAWYIVRNTRGVTGFVGPDSTHPVPLTEAEVEKMGVLGEPVRIDIAVGDTCRVLDGSFAGRTGEVISVDTDSQKAVINIEMFDKLTPLELDLDQLIRV